MNVEQIDALQAKINSLSLREKDKVPWLIRLLDSESGVIRHAVLWVLIHRFHVSNLNEKFWQMIDADPDSDVVLLLTSTMALRLRGSKDSEALKRLERAVSRFRNFRSEKDPMNEVLEDAKLMVIAGLDSKALMLLSPAQRRQILDEIDAPKC